MLIICFVFDAIFFCYLISVARSLQNKGLIFLSIHSSNESIASLWRKSMVLELIYFKVIVLRNIQSFICIFNECVCVCVRTFLLFLLKPYKNDSMKCLERKSKKNVKQEFSSYSTSSNTLKQTFRWLNQSYLLLQINGNHPSSLWIMMIKRTMKTTTKNDFISYTRLWFAKWWAYMTSECICQLIRRKSIKMLPKNRKLIASTNTINSAIIFMQT